MSETHLIDTGRETTCLVTGLDADAWVETYLAPRIAGRMRILDVGCGPGTIAAAVARAFPRAGVVALDESAARVELARTTLARFRNAQAVQGDVHDLPFGDDGFDLVYARFLFEYVVDKERAATELARVCRRGGTVVVQDLDGQLVNHYPPDARLERRIAAALRRLGRTGFDPFVGRKLFWLLQRAGLRECEVAVERYHSIAGAVDSAERRRWELKLDVAACLLEDAGVRDPGGLAADFLAYLDREDTITFSQLFTVSGRKAAAEEPPALRLVHGDGRDS